MDPSGNTVRMSSTSTTLAARSAPGAGPADKSSTDKRKPVRRDPERRRQQNIQAQKKYREKLRKRLGHLEAIAASVADKESDVAPCSILSPNVICSTVMTPPASNAPLSASEHTSPRYHNQHNQYHTFDQGSDSSVFSDLTTLSTSTSPVTASNTAFWDPSTSINPSRLVQNPTSSRGSHETLGIKAKAQLWVGIVDCGCLRPHVQLDQDSESGERQYRLLATTDIACNVYMPDPYANTLRCERLCVIQALMGNCMHIGITEDMFCDDESISPFFRQGGDSMNISKSESMVRKIQSIFKTLKPDVRPLKEQITIIHPPVYDVLPFPTFRKNLIKQRHMVDEDDLYDDLVNGLVCWGGSGLGDRERNVSTGFVSTGTPWDSRSWEARTWFLQKYWTMLGGEDGELVRQSEWWRNVRGEESDPWLLV